MSIPSSLLATNITSHLTIAMSSEHALFLTAWCDSVEAHWPTASTTTDGAGHGVAAYSGSALATAVKAALPAPFDINEVLGSIGAWIDAVAAGYEAGMLSAAMTDATPGEVGGNPSPHIHAWTTGPDVSLMESTAKGLLPGFDFENIHIIDTIAAFCEGFKDTVLSSGSTDTQSGASHSHAMA